MQTLRQWRWMIAAIVLIGLMFAAYVLLDPDHPCDGRTGAEFDVCRDQHDGQP